MKRGNKILLIAVFLIFMLFASYNFANFIVDKRYSESSGINEELQTFTNMIDDNCTYAQLKEQAQKLDREISFINGVCFQ